METVEHLSEDEIDELRAILRKKKEQEILEALEDARKESEEEKQLFCLHQKKLNLFLRN
ncbi:MAG: hypothetical protein WKG06_29785 [Segetibacter sp.]